MELSIGPLKVYITLPYRGLGMLLALIALTIVVYILMVRLRKKRVLKFANYKTLQRVHGFKSWIPHPGILIIKIITITLLFLVATQSIELNIVKPVANTDFVIAIDSSQTMLMPDYEPNRLSEAKSVAAKWLEKLPSSTKIGVIEFSEKAIPLTSMTTDYYKAMNAIDRVQVNLNSSGTAIGDAIELGTSMLASSHKQKFLIIITDGRNNAGMNVTDAVEDAKKHDVIIYTIGIAPTNETEALFNELKQTLEKTGTSSTNITFPYLDEKTLQYAAKETGGKFFLVNSPELFEESFKNIVIKNERIPLNSDYYVLMFVSFLLIAELLAYAKLGAL